MRKLKWYIVAWMSAPNCVLQERKESICKREQWIHRRCSLNERTILLHTLMLFEFFFSFSLLVFYSLANIENHMVCYSHIHIHTHSFFHVEWKMFQPERMFIEIMFEQVWFWILAIVFPICRCFCYTKIHTEFELGERF